MIHFAQLGIIINIHKNKTVVRCLSGACLQMALLSVIIGLGGFVRDTDAHSFEHRPVRMNHPLTPQSVESLKTLAPDVGLWEGPVLYFKPGGSPLYLILIEKALQELSLYRFDGAYTLIKRYRCVSGQRHGKKNKEKDKKTPEGIFFNTKTFRDKKITIFGDRAFGLNYPDIFDEFEGNGGSGIFLHGTNRALDSYSTNGCLVMRNTELKALDNRIDFKKTPVIIGERLPYTFTPSGRDFSELMPFLKNAMLPKKYAGSDSEISSLVILGMQDRVVALGEVIIKKTAGSANIRGYSKLHLAGPGAHFLVLIKREWHEETIPITIASARTHTSENKQKAKISSIQPLKIVTPPPKLSERPTPPPASQLPIAKTEVASSESETDRPTRSSHQDVQPEPEPSQRPALLPDKLPAVDHPDMTPPEKESPAKKTAVENSETAQPAKMAATGEQIKTIIESWRKAWEEKRLDDYIAFYHPDFEGKKKNRATWKKYKQILNRRNKRIRVKVSDIKLHFAKSRIYVLFRQDYRSDSFKGDGFKLLELKTDKDSWKIYREKMVKSGKVNAMLQRLKN